MRRVEAMLPPMHTSAHTVWWVQEKYQIPTTRKPCHNSRVAKEGTCFADTTTRSRRSGLARPRGYWSPRCCRHRVCYFLESIF